MRDIAEGAPSYTGSPSAAGAPERTIKAVIFDAGNTLITFNPTMAAITERALAGSGIRLTDDQRAQIEPLMWRYYAHYQRTLGLETSEEVAEEFWRQVYGALCRDLGLEQPEALGEAMRLAFCQPDAWQLFPDVLPALQALAARGVRMGIISNWTLHLREIAVALGLSPFFEFIAISAELGYDKPDLNIYRLALDGRGIDPADCLYVGDSLDNDCDSSLAFGMDFALIDRTGRHADAPCRRIGDLRDLLRLVEMAG